MPVVSKPTVLLTNDDGPPDAKESPYILGLYQHLTEQLGWDVKVVLPSSQKSWIGKAYHIKEITHGHFFYPKQDGTGDIETHPRPLRADELAEWILLDGTPATCANIGLHNIYPGQIDLVISGPNLGRNSSAAFALSSGTIGAAMSSSLSKTRSIAVSYGTVLHPTPTSLFEPAHDLACRIISYLWNNWGTDEGGLRQGGEIDLYNVNIPLVDGLLAENGLEICWTELWRNSYGRLFKQIPEAERSRQFVQAAGPDALTSYLEPAQDQNSRTPERLKFKFAPDMKELITPSPSILPEGSDAWALHQGWASITSLRASFAEPPVHGEMEKIRKLKL